MLSTLSIHHLIWSSQHCEIDIIISILQMKKPALKSLMGLCTVAGREWWDNVLMPVKSEKKVKLLSHVRLFVTPWTIACQALLSMGILQARILDWVAISFSAPFSPFPPWALNSNPKTVLFKKHPKQNLKTQLSLRSLPYLTLRPLTYWTCLGDIYLCQCFLSNEIPSCNSKIFYYNYGGGYQLW